MCCGAPKDEKPQVPLTKLKGPMSKIDIDEKEEDKEENERVIQGGPRPTVRNLASQRMSMQVAEDFGLANLEHDSQLSQIDDI